jgi:DNA end-binding protein Ku
MRQSSRTSTLRKLVKRKAAGHTIERPEAPERPSNVINLMDALRESLDSKKSAASSRRKKPASVKRRSRRAS